MSEVSSCNVSCGMELLAGEQITFLLHLVLRVFLCAQCVLQHLEAAMDRCDCWFCSTMAPAWHWPHAEKGHHGKVLHLPTTSQEPASPEHNGGLRCGMQ